MFIPQFDTVIMLFCMKIPSAITLWIVPLLLIPLCSANSNNSSNKVSLICEISDDRDLISVINRES